MMLQLLSGAATMLASMTRSSNDDRAAADLAEDEAVGSDDEASVAVSLQSVKRVQCGVKRPQNFRLTHNTICRRTRATFRAADGNPRHRRRTIMQIPPTVARRSFSRRTKKIPINQNVHIRGCSRLSSTINSTSRFVSSATSGASLFIQFWRSSECALFCFVLNDHSAIIVF